MDVPDTGERILLEKETPLMIARHRCAYRFSKDYVGGKQILDIGCGEGYGCFYLAESAKKVIGIDRDKAIIAHAKCKYRKENLQFCQIDVKDLKTLNDKFDTICAFQFIEHIKDTDSFLENIKNLLKDDGTFICSTPNRNDASPGSDTPLNKFHVKEYLLNEFTELLTAYFEAMSIFGLKRGKKLNCYRRFKKIGLLNFLPPAINPVKRFYRRIDCDNFIIVKDNLESTLDFIAVCKKYTI